ncbi:MAG: NADH-quinone oxidoreductase subunit L [Myxococcota bacterium]
MVNDPQLFELLRWIPALPLLAALLHGVGLALVRRPVPRGATILLSCGSVLASFLLSFWALIDLISLPPAGRVLIDGVYTWIGAGAFSAEVSFVLDPLSAVMCLVVSGVGALIHVYSVGYMDDDERDDKGFQRFFCYLNLFTGSMLILVLADNLLLMFLGWEGVGLCSYLLIGFWYGDRFYAYCGSKAFIVNRIGDVGVLVGLCLLFWAVADVGISSVAFRDIEFAFTRISDQTFELPGWLSSLTGATEWQLATVIGLCFFLGAVGKSAQLPLYVWLPDAMAGPTPVSALIHAATMVTAGVYLVCRMAFLYEASPVASSVIAWTGGATALFAATIALVQTDIKKVLAFSTVSQLGYMFLAAGCGAWSAAMFHVVTHAFFKGLLFLGAGVVILALHHEQDLRKMGGLRSRLPRVWGVMLAGVIGIVAVPYISAGFFSKDEILLSVWLAHDVPGHQALYAIGVLTGGLTAFYMFRMFFLVFEGPERGPAEVNSEFEKTPVLMVPLFVLAALSIFGGYLGPSEAYIPLEGANSFANFLKPAFPPAVPHEFPHRTEFWMGIGAFGVAVIGMLLAVWLYLRRPDLPERIAASSGFLHRALVNQYWVDQAYDAALVRPLVALSDEVLHQGIDVGVIDGAGVNGVAYSVRSFANDVLRYLQTGLVQGYLVAVVIGACVLVGWLSW